MLSLLLGGLSAAGSLFSGLGARSAAKSQQRRQDAYDAMARMANAQLSETILRDVPKRVVSDAAAAGFNPVTWLNGGALGFYNNAYSLQQWSPSQAINIPSVGQAVGAAITSGANAFGQQFRFEQKLGFEASALAAKLGAFGGRNASLPGADAISPIQSALGGAGTPYISAGGLITNRGAGGLSLQSVPSGWGSRARGSSDDDAPVGEFQLKAGETEATVPYPGVVISHIPNAEAAENRYGDEHPITKGFGWWVGLNDLSRTLSASETWGWKAGRSYEPGVSVVHGFRRGMADLFGYPVYDDGARGKSWGLPSRGYWESPTDRNINMETGGSFGGERMVTGGGF